MAAAAFGFASIAVYFINDVADAERDRTHPRKRYRPVAAGDLPKRDAVVLGAVCAVAGLAGGVLISEPLLTACVGAYLTLSFLYSWVLKHIPVVEVLFVASGFLLRVLGGAAATHVPPSGWFLLVCSLGAFGVAIAKRYTELTNLGAEAIRHRPVMRFYRPAALRFEPDHRGRPDDRGVPGVGGRGTPRAPGPGTSPAPCRSPRPWSGSASSPAGGRPRRWRTC